MKKLFKINRNLKQRTMIADDNGLGGTYIAVEGNKGSGGRYIFKSTMWCDVLTHQTVRGSSLRTKDK
tara:strand:- start:7199 stop:7399 length:201 start_codon:yes stop_codon:yes gene_type:complete